MRREHESESDDSGSEIPSGSKKIKYSQKFNKTWLNDPDFKGWLEQGEENSAYCKACKKNISVKTTGKQALVRHIASERHRTSLKSVKGQQTLASFKKFSNLEKTTKKSEMHIAAFVSEHNLSYNIMNHFVQLLPKICPDSEVARNIKCKPTKCSAIVNKVIGKRQLDNLCAILKSTKFSLIVDESTDRGCTKHLCLISRYRQVDKVTDSFLALIPLQGATADDLHEKIVRFFDNNGIPWRNNLIGFASDGASVMVGRLNSLTTKLQAQIQNLFTLKCICHSFSLCASNACSKLPRRAEDLVRNVYNFFSNSPKRIDTLKEFQTFTETPIHKILQPSQTRWLSLESAVNRILEQYNALVLFFTDAAMSEGVLAAQNILNDLKDPLTKAFLLFLQFVLPLFNNLNREMQAEKPKIHSLYSSISSSYKVLLEYFIKRDVIESQPLKAINYRDPGNFLPLEELYLGAKIPLLMLDRDSNLTLRKRCLEFFVESAHQICKRFDFNNEVLINMKLIDPATIINEKPPSVIPLAKHFPNLVNENQIQPIDNEWRLLRSNEILKDFPSNINAEEFWAKISKIQYGDDSFMFPLLSTFAFNMLSLPHSSANVERTFSQVNLMKTTHRNRLSSVSIVGNLHTKNYLKTSNQTCFSVDFGEDILKYHNSKIYKKQSEEGLTDDDSESDN
ncbi:unnamed protein product [Acanthoscelides obtectus]|uniref:HAT C-terminal dimerisation domain-containing protein n=1 Tax=Acanthoscelides obtectus TaxID=200917 RepID=A0A9P0M0F9_ACAOB|nr:unnamed protein product [Acanthoscelides obtectus]CAK1644607.1 Zinc finger protein 862 [Acanthoscelides obtectus]